MFGGSIKENIADAKQCATEEEIIASAKAANAHNFIMDCPEGYQTIVGEKGIRLSGGQRQRIAIARAILKNPRLLILDEATSALDTQSESNILQNMQNILKGRTAVVIAHRLSTIMQADKILVLYEGSIVEQGSHEELVARQGMYFQLVQKQMAGVAQ